MKEEETELIFFGRLEERKGLLEFVTALHHLLARPAPAFRVTFVGKVVPLYQAALQGMDSETFVRRELSGKVVLSILGDLESKAAIDYVKSSRNAVVCLASPSDNFPNAALEMGQVRCRLVVSDTKGFHQTLALIGRSEALYWFKPGCSVSMAEAIRSALVAVDHEPRAPTASEIEDLNRNLLRQRLQMLNEAYAAKQKPHTLAQACIKVAIISASGPQAARLVRRSLLALLRGQKLPESIVVALSGLAESRTKQLQLRFPKVVFIDHAVGSLQDIVRSAAGETQAGNYATLISAGAAMKPQALANLAKAGESGPALVISAEEVLGKLTRINSFEAPTVSLLAQVNRSCGSCLTLSTDFLDSLPPLNLDRPSVAIWRLVLAAASLGRRVAYLPLPQHSVRPLSAGDESLARTDEELAGLWRYLSSFGTGDWSLREVRNLFLSVQQLAVQIQKLRQRLHRATTELERARLEVGQSNSEAVRLRHELTTIREELREAKSIMGQTLASRSWRLTRPLRSLSSEIRNARAKRLDNLDK